MEIRNDSEKEIFRLAAIVDSSSDAIIGKDLDGIVTSWNRGAETIFGYSAAEMIGSSILRLIPDDRRHEESLIIGKIKAGERIQPFETVRRCKDGRLIDVSIAASPIVDRSGKVIGASKTARDITEGKRAEAALRRSREEFKDLFENAPVGYHEVDAEGRLFRINATELKMLGYAAEELLGEPVWKISGEEEVSRRAVLAKLRGESPPPSFERFLRRKDGSLFPALIEDRLIKDDAGQVLAIRAVVQDITEHKAAESRIRNLNRVYAVLSDINQTIVRIRNPADMLEAACRIAVEKGLFQAAWIGLADSASGPVRIAAKAGGSEESLQALTAVIGEETLACECPWTLHALRTGEHGVANDLGSDAQAMEWREFAVRKGFLSMAALPLKCEDAIVGTFNLYSSKRGFFDEDEMRLLDELAMDIGFAIELHGRELERRRIEDQFHQAQKMEAFGQLAGGIAHDFNNLLTVISGYSDMLIESTPADDPRYPSLCEIGKAAERSSALTRQLLAFSRKQVLAPKTIDLNDVIRDTEKMLRRIIGEDIALSVVLDQSLDCVKADPGQLEQVLLNLAVNARDAMLRGGKLTVETRNVELDESYAATHSNARPGRFAMLAVTDSGTGMPDEVKRRLFEPFFTTKGPGKGTGLGLAVVHGIVKQSGGSIEVYSEKDVGTAFKIYLPRIEAERPSREAPGDSGPIPLGNETILLIEDEESVRTITRRVLEKFGYSVIEADGGATALRIAAERREPIHLLITDVVMPGLGGREAAERMVLIHPEMKVLYISGYTDDAVVRHGVLHEQVDFLQKPFTQRLLAHKVREVLAKRA